jgi:hypothetical protein
VNDSFQIFLSLCGGYFLAELAHIRVSDGAFKFGQYIRKDLLEVKVSRCTSMFLAVIPFPLAARFSNRLPDAGISSRPASPTIYQFWFAESSAALHVLLTPCFDRLKESSADSACVRSQPAKTHKSAST